MLMRRAVVTAALSCLLLALDGRGALAQASRPVGERSQIGHGPTAVSVLRLAKRVVETAQLDGSRALDDIKNEALRLPLRAQLARSIRNARSESAFGDYVANAIDAWEFWDPRRGSPRRLLLKHDEARAEEARLAFLAGDEKGAKRLLGDRKCLTIFVVCEPPDVLFARWELAAGHLTAATRRLRQTDFQSDYREIRFAESVARAFIDAGRTREGFDVIAETGTRRNIGQVLMAQAYWRLGAVDEGRELMREATRAALKLAKSDATKAVPVSLADTQLGMGDREGAIETLNEIRGFPADRLVPIRGPLAGRLAWAGLDAEASAGVAGTLADRPVLPYIVIGQARRGDFDAAFATLRRLQALPLQVTEDTVGNPGLKSAVGSIARNAARAGSTNAYAQADAIRNALHPAPRFISTISTLGEGMRILQEDSDIRSLGDLTRAGEAHFAIAYALTRPDVSKRVEGLGRIAETLAGVPDDSYDPFAFFDAW